jgi:hypothetical protein
MLNFFYRKPSSLATSQGLINHARKTANDEICCAVDAELDKEFFNASISRTQVDQLRVLANLLEARRGGHELTPQERLDVRCGLNTLRDKIIKT